MAFSKISSCILSLLAQIIDFFYEELFFYNEHNFSKKTKMNYIYLLREREFMRLDESVYKLGRTTQRNLKRLLQHSKGSELLFQSICTNCREVEIGVRAVFKENYTYRDDFGYKYFEGCVYDMIHDICTYLRDHIDDEINILVEGEDDYDDDYEDEDDDEDEDEDGDEDEDEDEDEDGDEDDEAKYKMEIEEKGMSHDIVDLMDEEEDEDEDEDEEEEDEDEDDEEGAVFDVERIVGHRNIKAMSDGAQFIVKWKGYNSSENTTESWNELKHTVALFNYITGFHTRKWMAVRAALFADIQTHGNADIQAVLQQFLQS